MELTPELLASGAVGLIVVIGAVGKYLQSRAAAPKQIDPVLAGVGLELGNREQVERLIGFAERVAKALEALADKRQADMQETLDELLKRLEVAERSGRPRRRPSS